MIQYYKTGEQETVKVSAPEKDCWIRVTAPSAEETEWLSKNLNLPSYVFQDPLDSDERSRVETTEDFILFILRIPVFSAQDIDIPYFTLPVGIVMTSSFTMTVCGRQSEILEDFACGRIRNFSTLRKNRFVLQIFLQTALTYLKYLKEINKRSSQVEQNLQETMENRELNQLLNLEKSLVFFTTSLKSNEIMMEKIQKNRTFRTQTEEDTLIEDALASIALKYENLMERLQKNQVFIINTEEENLLEDVIIENKQAIEMANIYSNILSSMMGTFASIISNNLNRIMKLLTAITIILMLPTLLASIYGMNIRVPFQESPYAFTFIMGLCVFLALAGFFLFKKKKMF